MEKGTILAAAVAGVLMLAGAAGADAFNTDTGLTSLEAAGAGDPGKALVLSAPAATGLLGVSWTGAAYLIDETNGNGSFLGMSGYTRMNSLARDASWRYYSTYGIDHGGEWLVTIDPGNGAATVVRELPFLGVRAMAFGPDGTLYAISQDPHTASPAQLFHIDGTGQATLVRTYPTTVGLQALEFSPNGVLYAWESVGTSLDSPRGLATIDPQTGQVTEIGTLAPGAPNIQSLAFGSGGSLYGVYDLLYRVDPATGATSVIGGSGFSNVRGIEFVPEPATLSLLALGGVAMLRRRRK